MLTYMTAV